LPARDSRMKTTSAMPQRYFLDKSGVNTARVQGLPGWATSPSSAASLAPAHVRCRNPGSPTSATNVARPRSPSTSNNGAASSKSATDAFSMAAPGTRCPHPRPDPRLQAGNRTCPVAFRVKPHAVRLASDHRSPITGLYPLAPGASSPPAGQAHRAPSCYNGDLTKRADVAKKNEADH
jgi:hypothetical protein